MNDPQRPVNTSMFAPYCFIVAFTLFAVGIVVGLIGSPAYIWLFTASITVAAIGFVVYIIQEWYSG